MTNVRNLGRALLLTALMVGLSALGVLKHRHGHPLAPLAASHHALPVHTGGAGRGSSSSNRSRSSSHGVSASDHQDAAVQSDLGTGTGPHAYVAVLVRTALLHFAPEFLPAPFSRENTLAYGCAPRAPGLTRGPPVVLS